MGNSEVKDKRICIFEIVTDRSARGFERKIKKPVTTTEKVWSYVRDLTEKEKFAAKAAGLEQSALFKVVFSPKIKAGQYIEFKGAYFRITSVDRFEFYNRDLSIRAIECNLPEVRDDNKQ